MDIFDTLLQAKEAYRQTKDIVGKVTGIGIAPVYKVFEDDTVTVLLPESGGRSPSPRLYRVLPGWSETYPAVRPGDTVAYGFIEGNPNKGVYWGVLHNAINPPASLDSYSYQLGNTNTVITKDSVSHYVADVDDPTKPCGIVITLNSAKIEKVGVVGASLEVTDGAVTIKAGTMTYTFTQAGLSVSGGGSGAMTLTGMTSVSINSKQVATIGAVDTHSDTLTTRGW